MELDCPRKSAHNRRGSQEQVKKTLGRKPAGWIEEKPIPAYAQRLWAIFWDIDSGRTNSEPIGYTEIQSYCNLMRIYLSPLDVKVVKAMDVIRVSKTHEVRNKDG